MKYILMLAVSAFIVSCEHAHDYSFNSSACTVKQVTGGAQITCPDGTTQFVSNGTDGSTGPQGNTGAAGTAGSNGTNGTNGSNGTNGTNGTNGSNGHNALVGSSVADPSVCSNGGSVYTMGTDSNDDSTLELTEVSTTAVVCNGTNGVNAAPTPFSTVSLVEPCAADPNHPTVVELANPNLEVFLKLANGELLASVSSDMQGDYTHLGAVAPNMTWQSTGIGSNCTFTVDSSGNITKL